MSISTIEMTHEQWLTERRRGIGGSDAGAILGLNPWCSAVDVYLDKIGQAEPKAVTDAMEAGNRLEPVVAEWWSDITGWPTRRDNQIRAHAEETFILGNLDRTIKADTGGEGVGVLEIKTTSSRNLAQCAADDTEYPLHWFAQLQHYLLVTGYRWGAFAVLVDGRQIRNFTVTRDDEFIGVMLLMEKAFWINHVVQRIPPEAKSCDDLIRLYPASAAQTVTADVTIEAACHNLALIRQEEKELAQRHEALELVIKNTLLDRDTLIDLAGRTLATWKTSKDSVRFDLDRFKTEHPDLYAEYQRSTPGSRRFLLK